MSPVRRRFSNSFFITTRMIQMTQSISKTRTIFLRSATCISASYSLGPDYSKKAILAQEAFFFLFPIESVEWMASGGIHAQAHRPLFSRTHRHFCRLGADGESIRPRDGIAPSLGRLQSPAGPQ